MDSPIPQGNIEILKEELTSFGFDLNCSTLRKETVRELCLLLESAGVQIDKVRFLKLMGLVDDCLEGYWNSFIYAETVKNQEALREFLGAFDALDEGDQVVLCAAFLKALHVKRGRAGQKITYHYVFRRVVQNLIKDPARPQFQAFEEIKGFVFQKSSALFVDLGLDPEGDDKNLFDTWTRHILEDPLFVDVSEDLASDKKEEDKKLSEKAPTYVTGKTVKSGASASGKKRSFSYQPRYEKARQFMEIYHKKKPCVSFTQVRKKAAAEIDDVALGGLRNHIKKTDFPHW